MRGFMPKKAFSETETNNMHNNQTSRRVATSKLTQPKKQQTCCQDKTEFLINGPLWNTEIPVWNTLCDLWKLRRYEKNKVSFILR